MAGAFETFSLQELTAKPEDAFRLASLAADQGREIRAYSGSYYRYDMGDARLSVRAARNYETGELDLCGMDIALAGAPDLLVLDEPVNGLDPQGIIETRELILRLNRERQITVLISSHILDELSRLATHYGFIDGGRMVKEISAAELENVCRKCVRLEVTDTKILSHVLDSMHLDYNILSDTEADVFAKINITQLTLALAEKNCEILSLQERDETLESYYVNLIGGTDYE